MPTGFVMMLFSKREPNPDDQISSLVGASRDGSFAYFLSRKVIGARSYKAGKSRVGFIGDAQTGRKFYATATYMNVIPLDGPSRDVDAAKRELSKESRDALKDYPDDFKCIVELRDVVRCPDGTTLKSLDWKTVAHGNHKIPDYQGGSYFRVKHA